MRQIQVSIDVFSEIWKKRNPGESSEDEILRRVLKIPPPHLDKQKYVETVTHEENPSIKEMEMKDTMKWAQNAAWWEVVYAALYGLGGKAPLREIYKSVDQIVQQSGKRRVKELEATVRGTLEDNSSDSGRYKGVRDVFSMPEGKHSGVWATREK